MKVLKTDFPLTVQIHFIGYQAPSLLFEDDSQNYEVLVKLSPLQELGIIWREGVMVYPMEMGKDGLRVGNMIQVR